MVWNFGHFMVKIRPIFGLFELPLALLVLATPRSILPVLDLFRFWWKAGYFLFLSRLLFSLFRRKIFTPLHFFRLGCLDTVLQCCTHAERCGYKRENDCGVCGVARRSYCSCGVLRRTTTTTDHRKPMIDAFDAGDYKDLYLTR